MAQPSFPGRGAYSGRMPDRPGPSSSQPQFGQSAPGFGRQLQYVQQQQPQTYSQYGTGPGYAGGRGQAQAQTGGIGMGVGPEKETNVVNELTEEQRDEIDEAV